MNKKLLTGALICTFAATPQAKAAWFTPKVQILSGSIGVAGSLLLSSIYSKKASVIREKLSNQKVASKLSREERIQLHSQLSWYSISAKAGLATALLSAGLTAWGVKGWLGTEKSEKKQEDEILKKDGNKWIYTDPKTKKEITLTEEELINKLNHIHEEPKPNPLLQQGLRLFPPNNGNNNAQGSIPANFWEGANLLAFFLQNPPAELIKNFATNNEQVRQLLQNNNIDLNNIFNFNKQNNLKDGKVAGKDNIVPKSNRKTNAYREGW